MSKHDDCEAPREHNMHLCKLLKNGLMAELDQRSAKPTAVCCKCGQRARDPKDLCQPRPL